MSGTRSISHAAPATDGSPGHNLVIVAHGDRGGIGGDRLIRDIASRVSCWPELATVQTCFVRGRPTITSVGESLLAAEATVYPLFMSDGYYVKQAIPEQLRTTEKSRKHRQIRIMRPIGLSPKLPKIIADLAIEAAIGAGKRPEHATLLLVAHGSQKSPDSRDATRSVSSRLSETGLFGGIETAFLEETPFLGDQLGSVTGPVIAVGLFIGEGLHGAEDLPAAIRESGRGDIVLADPLSRCPAVLDLVCDELSRELADRRPPIDP